MNSAVVPAFVRWLDKFNTAVAKTFAWSVILLVIVTVFDVVSRRFFVVGSVFLQELEWHLHAILFFTAIGYAYIKGAHVRIDLVASRLSAGSRLWIEIAGILLLALPFCAVVLVTGIDYARDSYLIGEMSSSRAGIPYRWVIKCFLPISAVLLLLALISRLLTCSLALRTGDHETGILLLQPGFQHDEKAS